jgi:MtN3 and saliva related transmembrane protein
MNWEELLGFIGGALMTLGLIPQVWRLYKLRSAKEISLPFTLLFLVGTACWLTYGIMLRLPPVILWNSISLLLGIAMLFAKIKYGRATGVDN